MENGQPLPQRIKVIWRFDALWIFLIALAVAVGSYVALQFWSVTFFHWTLWLGVAGAIVGPLIIFLLIPYWYRFQRYQISDDDVELQSGFIFRKRVAVPIGRVQDVKLAAGPLFQWQKLQQVTIQTASTSHEIGGLDPEVAEQLRDQIIQLAKEARQYEV